MDDIEATIGDLDEDLLGLGLGLFDEDFFGMSSLDPLTDFPIDCEGDIDSFIRTLEETLGESERDISDSSQLTDKQLISESNSALNKVTNIDIVNSKCKTKSKLKALNEDKVVFRRNKKRKGISLLAKPTKVREKSSKGKSISPTRFATYFYEDHNYCPLNSNPSNTNIRCKSSINENALSDCNLSLHGLHFFDDFESISLEIESEVIMNLDVENEVDECCESVISSNDDLNKESSYSSNSESECATGSSAVEVNLEADETDKEVNNLQISAKPSKVFRMRQLSTRSSVCSSRSSSLSSSCSSCSCSSRTTSRCRSRSPNRERIRSRSRSVSSSDNRRGKFRRKKWIKDSNTFAKRGDLCGEDRKNWYLDRRKERLKEVEERRIVYVGNIPDGTTKTDLRYWFAKFGPITQVSVHFRDYGNNYAFVTFQRRSDAYEAVQRGNDDSRHPKFDLSFGGRRNFCKNRYEDLDRMEKEDSGHNMDFDSLLRSTKTRYRQ